MRIALVTPPYNLLEEGYGTKMYSRHCAYPPLGIGYVASGLEGAGHDIRIIDGQSALMGNAAIGEAVRGFGAEAVGISAVTACADSACKLATFLKKKLAIPVFMGGAHPTCFPEAVYERTREIDFLVIGEGERTAVEMAALIGQKAEWKNVDGICFLDDADNFIRTGRRGPVGDLDEIAPPARHLYDSRLYRPIPNLYRQLPATNMITSRGCPYARCAFCYESGRMKQPYRRHSPERVIAEIKELVRTRGIREIAFWDDNFIARNDWAKRFCELLIAEKLGITWSAYSRVDMVDKETLSLLARAGCWSIFYGLESGSQELLDVIDKGITLEQGRSAVRWTHEAGIQTRGSFMLALPGENPGLAKKTVDFAIELDLDSAQFLTTYPEYGTKLYDKAASKGQFMEYRGRHGVTYVPEGYRDADEVEKAMRRAYTRFYLRPSFCLKYLRRIKTREDFFKFFEGFKMILGITGSK